MIVDKWISEMRYKELLFLEHDRCEEDRVNEKEDEVGGGGMGWLGGRGWLELAAPAVVEALQVSTERGILLD